MGFLIYAAGAAFFQFRGKGTSVVRLSFSLCKNSKFYAKNVQWFLRKFSLVL